MHRHGVATVSTADKSTAEKERLGVPDATRGTRLVELQPLLHGVEGGCINEWWDGTAGQRHPLFARKWDVAPLTVWRLHGDGAEGVRFTLVCRVSQHDADHGHIPNGTAARARDAGLG